MMLSKHVLERTISTLTLLCATGVATHCGKWTGVTHGWRHIQ